MNADDFRECLATIGWSQRFLAEKLGTHTTTVQRWARGKQPIPAPVEEWLPVLANFHKRNAAPKGWLKARSERGVDDRE